MGWHAKVVGSGSWSGSHWGSAKLESRSTAVGGW